MVSGLFSENLANAFLGYFAVNRMAAHAYMRYSLNLMDFNRHPSTTDIYSTDAQNQARLNHLVRDLR